MHEEWKGLPDWEDRYDVSTHGRIRSLSHRGKPRKTPKVMSPNISPRGYHKMNLMRDLKTTVKLLHRAVLETFVGPCPEGMECAHLDGNPLNNRLNNLRWCTKKENMAHKDEHGTTSRGEHRPLAVFTEDEVRSMRNEMARGAARADIVRQVVATKGCDPTVVRDILGFRTWKHVK